MLNTNHIKESFDSELFRKNGIEIINLLADYLKNISTIESGIALPSITPDEMLKIWDNDFSDPADFNLPEILKKIINSSNHLHNPKFIGHQVCSPLPISTLFELIGKFLNNASAIYEMGPVNVILEKRLIEWMCGLIGFDKNADGFFTSGGTIGNLTALLAARQERSEYDLWKEGVNSDEKLAIMAPESAHYSIARAAGIMGMGENSVIPIPMNAEFKTDTDILEEIYQKETRAGKKIIVIVGNACSTALGTYDNLSRIADFAEKHNLWFHVDGAHGASALLSEKYQYLLKGICRADSMIWDAHKMMLMPALITAVIFRNGKNSYEAFSQKASYLFEKSAQEEWYNYAHRTMECTKNMMGTKLYLCLKLYGSAFFGNYVTSMYDLTREFAEIINGSLDFELAADPDSNIICFRYMETKGGDINETQQNIRKKVLQSEKYYLVQTALQSKQYLRCTIINPLTTITDLTGLLELIRNLET